MNRLRAGASACFLILALGSVSACKVDSSTSLSLAVSTSETTVYDQTANILPVSLTYADGADSKVSLSASAADSSLIPSSAIVVSGSGRSRSVTITPSALSDAGATPLTSVTITASEGSSSSSATVPIRIRSNSSSLSVSSVSDVTLTTGFNSDETAFTLTDSVGSTSDVSVTAASSNTTLLPVSGIVLRGTGSSRTFQLFPVAGKIGSATVTLTAANGTRGTSRSFALTVGAGGASHVRFSTQPASTGTTSAALSTQPEVSVTDTYGNIISSSTASVTLAAYTDSSCLTAAGGTLSGGGPVTASSGYATFSSVNYSASGKIYLKATSSGLTPACSSAITLSDGVATKLSFSTQPSSSGTISTSLAYSPVVEIQDASGTVVSSATNSVTLAAYTDSSCTVAASGSVTAGSNPLSATSGIASFTATQYSGAGVIYLGASAAGLTSACSNAITVAAGTPTKVVFQTQPSSSGNAGIALSQSPVVAIQDSSSNTGPTATDQVTLTPYLDSACSTTPASGSLTTSGGNPGTPSNGLVTFSSLSYSGTGTLYLKASSGTLTSACSSAITLASPPVISGLSNQTLSAAAAPTTGALSYTLTSTSPDPTTYSITASSSNTSLVPTSSISLGGAGAARTVTVTAAAGKTGSSLITLTATSGSVSVSASFTVTVTAGAASQLGLVKSLAPVERVNRALPIQPMIAVQDSYGNTVTTASSSVTLSAWTDSGCSAAAGGTLTVTTNPVSASSGVATFSGVKYDTASTIYLQATDGTYTSCFGPIVFESSSAWTWLKGSNTNSQSGTYGTQGTADSANKPGARSGSVTWKDSGGNLWLFGGYGRDSAGTRGYLNDLWKFNPITSKWTWMSGSNTANGTPTYGTQGTAASANTPGARYRSVAWKDSSGVFWLFGGSGYDGSGNLGAMNDLWKYDTTKEQWTWVSGSSSRYSSGSYGVLLTASSSNQPKAREAAAGWIDSSNRLYLFGGYSDLGTGSIDKLNDLWRYDPSTGYWTWISGSSSADAQGSYGTLQVAGSGSPGARVFPVTWTDGDGNSWLFGGYGRDKDGALGFLNDLWKYTPSSTSGSGYWTWMAGSSTRDATGSFGTQGVSASTNVPSARSETIAWVDSGGDLWLFGGQGYDSTGTQGYLSDLWKYDVSASQWTWTSGVSARNGSGTYGTQGDPDSGNLAGSRAQASAWVDGADNLWIFGGFGYDASSGAPGDLNDLFVFTQ